MRTTTIFLTKNQLRNIDYIPWFNSRNVALVAV